MNKIPDPVTQAEWKLQGLCQLCGCKPCRPESIWLNCAALCATNTNTNTPSLTRAFYMRDRHPLCLDRITWLKTFKDGEFGWERQ